MNKTKTRDIIVWIAAVVAFCTGIGLCIAGFCVPPEGEIDGSVLAATGAYNKYTFNAGSVSSSVCRFTIPFFNIVTQTPDVLLIDYDTDTASWSAQFLLASQSQSVVS